MNQTDKLKQEVKALKLRLTLAMGTIENLRLQLALYQRREAFKTVKEGLISE